MSESRRVALVHEAGGHDRDGYLPRLAEAIRGAGHEPSIVTGRSLPVTPLRWRGFAESLAGVPLTLAKLSRERFDVAHACSPAAAVAALAWRRRGGGPVVFAPIEPVTRERLADLRLRLWMLERALEDSDAVVAPSAESQAAMSRWLAIDAPLLEPADAPALYEKLLAGLAGRR